MTDFLFRLLQMSVAGSLLAGLIFLWRRILRKEAVHTIFYYMWILVLLRLCVPFGVTISLPVAGEWSFASNRESQAYREADRMVSAEPMERSGEAKADSPDTSLPAGAPNAADAAGEATRGLGLLGVPFLWMLVWGAGTVFCLGRYVTGYVRFVHALGNIASEAPQKAREVLRSLDPDGCVRILECPFVATPMLIGLLRPVIVLPAGIGEERQLRDILAHELVHARRHDLLYKWFAVAVTSLHWFNPVMFLVRREIGRACELSCDEAVMRGMDEESRQHYGETLLSLAEALPAGSGLVAMTLCEEKKQLKERLVCIATWRNKGVAAVLVSLYVVIHLGGCAMISGADFVRADASGTKTDGDAADAALSADLLDGSTDTGSGAADGSRVHDSSGAGGSKTTDLLRAVLLGEKSFLCMNGSSGPISMNIAQAASLFSPDSEYTRIWEFTVIDLDGDGEEEAIVRVIAAAGDMGGCLVLHCAEDEVYSFATGYQAFESLKTDGTYNDKGGGILDGICRMGFSGDNCTFDWLVSCALSDTAKHTGTESGDPELSYFVNGAPVTENEWSAALDEQSEKEDAAWYLYSKEEVEARLAGEGHFSVVHTPDDAEPEKDIAAMYHFPVRVSDTRVLTVALETKEAENDYFSVDRMYVYDGDMLIQTIETTALTPSEDYLWEGLFVNRGHEEGEPDVRDVNFDGAEDFGLLCASAYPKNLPFTYFYWNEAEGRFVQGFTIFGGEALEVDDGQKCLIEHWYDVDGEHTTRYA